MGNSIGLPGAIRASSFTHKFSKTSFAVFSQDGKARQRIERNGLVAEHAVAYRIGSGNHATGFLVRIGEWLFQSPAAFYKRIQGWDVAPGYEAMSRPDFNRRVTADCLACHSSGSPDALQPIGCEQCHGDSRKHLQKPSRSNIVNPSRLTPVARDAVCERCHLNGEARISNPPEHEQNQSVAVYERPGSDLRVVSHVEQLALSACVRSSEGRLWCGTCHQPHGTPIAISAQCISCHGMKMPVSHRQRKECTSCHMPRRDAVDGGHSAFTDHRIQRIPAIATTSPAKLRLWRDISNSDLRERNLGLAHIQAGEREGSSELINEGFRRLASIYPKFPRDPEVLTGLGMVLFLKDQKADARKLLEAAVTLKPQDASLHEKLALIRRGTSDLPGAIESLERSILLDPGRESAYFFLVECQPSRERKIQILERLLAVFPQSLIARESLRDLKRR